MTTFGVSIFTNWCKKILNLFESIYDFFFIFQELIFMYVLFTLQIHERLKSRPFCQHFYEGKYVLFWFIKTKVCIENRENFIVKQRVDFYIAATSSKKVYIQMIYIMVM